MPLDITQLSTSAPQQFYSTAPDPTTTPNQAPYATASASGTVTLTFPTVPSGQAYTGSVTIIPAVAGALSGTIWTATRDGSTPFLTWYDNQVAVDIQAKDGQALTIMGTGLTSGQQVSAVWAGRNDTSANTPVVAPSVSGAPSYASLIAAINNAVSLLALEDILLGVTAPSALTTAAGVAIAQDFLHANVGVTTEVAALLATGSASGTPGGVPLLRQTQNLGSGSGNTVAGASTNTLISTTAINQPGYEAEFTVNMPASSGTIPFVQVKVVWTDATSGLTVGQRTFFLTCGNGTGTGGPLNYYIFGNTRGNEVSVTITNLDPSITATYSWTFNTTSHVYTADKLIQLAYGATQPNGYNNPAGTPNAGALLNSNPSIPASSTVTRLCACYSGRAIFSVNNTGTVSLNAFLADPVTGGSGLYGNSASRYVGFSPIAAGDTVDQEVFLPYGPMQLQIVNAQTSAGSGNFGIITADY